MRIATLARIAPAAAVALVAAAALLDPSAALAQGCAMCKTALDGPVDPLTEAFNVSSLFLMATPYTVVGTIGAWIYIASRRRAPQVDQDDATSELE
jgi:hypothetical protein